jgi:hypothetical protein
MSEQEDALETKHTLARIVIEALILLYGAGSLTDDERRTVGKAADVLQALLARE